MQTDLNTVNSPECKTLLTRATVRLINYLSMAGLKPLQEKGETVSMQLIQLASLQLVTEDQKRVAPWLGKLVDWHAFMLSSLLGCSREDLVDNWDEFLTATKGRGKGLITTRSIPKLVSQINKFLDKQEDKFKYLTRFLGDGSDDDKLESLTCIKMYSCLYSSIEDAGYDVDDLTNLPFDSLDPGLLCLLRSLVMQRFDLTWDQLPAFEYQLNTLYIYVSFLLNSSMFNTTWMEGYLARSKCSVQVGIQKWVCSMALLFRQIANRSVIAKGDPLTLQVSTLEMFAQTPLWVLRDSALELLVHLGEPKGVSDSDIVDMWDLFLDHNLCKYCDLRTSESKAELSVESRITFPRRLFNGCEDVLYIKSNSHTPLRDMIIESTRNMMSHKRGEFAIVAELPTYGLLEESLEFLQSNFATIVPLRGSIPNPDGSLIPGVTDEDLLCRVETLSREEVERMKAIKWEIHSTWLASQFTSKVMNTGSAEGLGIGDVQRVRLDIDKDSLYLVTLPIAMVVVLGDSVDLAIAHFTEMYNEERKATKWAQVPDFDGPYDSDDADLDVGYDPRLALLRELGDLGRGIVEYRNRDDALYNQMSDAENMDDSTVGENFEVSDGAKSCQGIESAECSADQQGNNGDTEDSQVLEHQDDPEAAFLFKRDCIKVACENSGLYSSSDTEKVVMKYEDLECNQNTKKVSDYAPAPSTKIPAMHFNKQKLMSALEKEKSVIKQYGSKGYGVSVLPDLGFSLKTPGECVFPVGREPYTHVVSLLGSNEALYTANKYCFRDAELEDVYPYALTSEVKASKINKITPSCCIHFYKNIEIEQNGSLVWSPMLILSSDLERQFKSAVDDKIDYWLSSKLSGVLAITSQSGGGKTAALKHLGVKAIQKWGVGSIYVLGEGVFSGGNKMPFQTSVGFKQRLLHLVSKVAKHAQGNVLFVFDDLHKVASTGREDPMLEFIECTDEASQLFPKVKFAFSSSDSEFRKCLNDVECAGLQHIKLGKFDGMNGAIVEDIQLVVRRVLELDRSIGKAQELYSKCEKIATRYLSGGSTPMAILQVAEALAIGLKNSRKDCSVDDGSEPDWDDLLEYSDKGSARAVTLLTGKKYDNIKLDRTVSLLNIEQELKKTIRGQDDAISVIARSLRRASFVVNDPNRPISSMLFVGPTGVGKTGLAKALAKYQFGSEKSMIRVDMSEYSERFNISKFIGSPPGYVGYKDGSAVTDLIRRDPQSILLLDEIEKASPQVLTLLLQILDEGRITDAAGAEVDCTNLIVIMTSNIGSRELFEKKGRLGFSAAEENEFNTNTEIVMEEVKKVLAPELFNRIDATVVFNALSSDVVQEIFEIILAEISSRLSDKGIILDMTLEAKCKLCELGFDKKFGARPLRRTLESKIVDGVIVAVLEKGYDSDCVVRCGYNKDTDEFRFDVIPY